MISVLINGIEKSDLITFNSVSKIDNLNSQIDNFSFTIKNTKESIYKPDLNDEIIVTRDATKVFAGRIVRIDDDTDKSERIVYKVYCNDYSQDFKKPLVTVRFTDTTLFAVLGYLMDEYTTGFTYVNIAGDVDIESFSFNRLNLVDSLQKLADALSYVWYVDYDKDLHFFPRNTESAPFNLTDVSNNYIKDSLSITEDITQIRNSILVQGGSAISNATRTEHITTDGENDMFNLKNKFAEVPVITLATVSKTVGVENVDNDEDYDIMWNYNQKTIRFTTLPTIGQDVAITGLYEYPILIRAESLSSITDYGKYEFAITDNTILSQNQAFERAKAELSSYQAELYEGQFKTYTDGLRSGQILNIDLDSRNRNIDVLIQSVTTVMTDPNADKFEYTVKFATLKSVGIIEYLQRQLRKENVSDESSEVLLSYFDVGHDSLDLTDSFAAPYKKSGPYVYSGDSATLYRIQLTIDHTKVSGSVAHSQEIWLDLSDLPDEFFEHVMADGSDISIYKEDEITEVAYELVSINTTAKTGEIFFTSEVSPLTDTIFYLHYFE